MKILPHISGNLGCHLSGQNNNANLDILLLKEANISQHTKRENNVQIFLELGLNLALQPISLTRLAVLFKAAILAIWILRRFLLDLSTGPGRILNFVQFER